MSEGEVHSFTAKLSLLIDLNVLSSHQKQVWLEEERLF